MTEQASRSLIDCLKQVGTETVQNHGRSATRMEMLARLTWDFVLDGEVHFPDGMVVRATPATWVASLKWLYAQLLGKSQPAAGVTATAAPPAAIADLLSAIESNPPALPLNRHQRRAAHHR